MFDFLGSSFQYLKSIDWTKQPLRTKWKQSKQKKKKFKILTYRGVRATNSYFSLPIFSQPIFKLNDCIGPAIYLASCHYLWETISIWPLKEYFNWLISGLSTGYAVNGFKKFFYAWALIKVYLIKMWHD